MGIHCSHAENRKPSLHSCVPWADCYSWAERWPTPWTWGLWSRATPYGASSRGRRSWGRSHYWPGQGPWPAAPRSLWLTGISGAKSRGSHPLDTEEKIKCDQFTKTDVPNFLTEFIKRPLNLTTHSHCTYPWVRLNTVYTMSRYSPWWWVPDHSSCLQTQRRWWTLLCPSAWTWRASWTGTRRRPGWTAPSAPHWSDPWLNIVTLLVTSHKRNASKNYEENGKNCHQNLIFSIVHWL